MAAFLFQTPGSSPPFTCFWESVVGTAAHDVCLSISVISVIYLWACFLSDYTPERCYRRWKKECHRSSNSVPLRRQLSLLPSWWLWGRGGGLPFYLSDLSSCRIAAQQHGHVYSCTVWVTLLLCWWRRHHNLLYKYQWQHRCQSVLPVAKI